MEVKIMMNKPKDTADVSPWELMDTKQLVSLQWTELHPLHMGD